MSHWDKILGGAEMKILGAVVFVVGAFLWCGNVFRFFPTFPFLGYLTMLGGVALYKVGDRNS
jgi:hypothetical protein